MMSRTSASAKAARLAALALWAALAWMGATLTSEAWAADKDLHIPQGKNVNFTHNMNDGAGYLWDIQYYLNIGQGTNYVYGGGLYCRIYGNNISSNGRGWANAAGDEIEIGPYSQGSVQVYRRLKIYKEQGVGLARWLDIVVNNTATAQNVPVQIYSSYNYTVNRTTTSTGAAAAGPKDWACITEFEPNSNRPSLLHIYSTPNSKLPGNVRCQGNVMTVDYNLSIPANSTVVLCYFESQGNTINELQTRMKNFRASQYLKDLSPAVKKLIINMKTGSDLEEVELERSTSSDTVILRNGDSVFGEIANEKFGIETFYGKLDLPAKQVVGFAAVPGQEDLVRAVLVGGQVLTGKLKDENLAFALPTGGSLTVPFNRIKECSYAITKARPAEAPLVDPLIMLRTGDRLAFDPAMLKCSFQTRHGKIELNGKDLLEVRLDQEEHGIHRAEFINGSKLAGLLEPEKVVLPLKLGPKLDIPRDMIQALRFMNESKEGDDLARVRLDNDDELLGKLADEQFLITTDYGTVNVKPANISAMNFDRNDPSKVAITMWDGSVLRGQLQQDSVKFGLTPGPVVTLHIDLIAVLSCPQSLPPDDVVKKVEKLVAMLAAAAYKDRQDAQEELTRLGPKIIPLLKKSLADGDPEVRQRLSVILETLGQKVEEPKAEGNPPMPLGLIRGNVAG